MNHSVFQQNAFAPCDEMRNSVSISDRKDPVVCPKPRRLGVLNHAVNDPVKPFRWYLSHQTELYDAKAGTELLDIILAKGGCGLDQQAATQVTSSPPFFCGSPPSRASNPLIQDARFGEEKMFPTFPLSPLSIPFNQPQGFLSSSPPPHPPSSSSSSATTTSTSTRKGVVAGCVRAKFGHKPAAVRIEGFDCLDRDRRNCSIPAVA